MDFGTPQIVVAGFADPRLLNAVSFPKIVVRDSCQRSGIRHQPEMCRRQNSSRTPLKRCSARIR